MMPILLNICFGCHDHIHGYPHSTQTSVDLLRYLATVDRTWNDNQDIQIAVLCHSSGDCRAKQEHARWPGYAYDAARHFLQYSLHRD